MADTHGKVAQLWRYPVSSFAGEVLPSGMIEATGLAGDRLWGAIDLQNGEIARPGKQPRWDATPGVEARLADPGAGDARIEIRIADEPPPGDPHLPDQPWHAGDSPGAEAVLRRHFGFAVGLRRHPGPTLAGSAATVKPRYAVRHLHLLSLQSLAALRRLLPQSRVDARRFRPNLLVDLPGAQGPFPETDWPVGTELAVGAARLRVVEPCRRCVFVTVRHGDLPRDVEVLRAIAEHNKGDLGTICDVVTPGAVKPGDSVKLG